MRELNKLQVKSKISDYEILFIDSVDKIIDEIHKSNTITFIDSKVASLYPELAIKNAILVDCIEEVKTINGANVVLSQLIERKANVNTKLVVIGGGILQDVIGFCASVYCRGLQYILVPTTLLAQVDSCVGGKTSLNFQNRKNILGTFYPPSKILIYPNLVNTLSNLDFISGLGEVYKFYILQNKIKQFDITQNIKDMIYDSLKYKIEILCRDEFDKGERKLLNFGHTFGHAIEISSDHKVPHGIAVIIGSMVALTISLKLGYNIPDYEYAISLGKNLIKQSKIKFSKLWFDYDILKEIIKSDKKNQGKLMMVLINTIPFLTFVENDDILRGVLGEIYESI